MALQNSLTNKPQRLGLTAYLTRDAVKDQITKVVGGRNGQSFITSIISAVQANPALQECENSSILSAALLGETLKLSPSPQLGYYYMVPFKNNKKGTTEAQFQLGYKGMLLLAQRSGMYRKLNALAIKEGELVRYDPLDESIEVNLIDDEVTREQATTIGYYATYELLNGFKKTLYWSKQKMEAHALRYSKGYAAHKGYTFWEKDFDAMALKTMYRRLLATAPMSIDMQTAIEADQAVIREDGTKDYIDVVEEQPEPQTAAEPQQQILYEKPTVSKNPPKQKNIPDATPTSQADIESMFFGGQTN